MGRYTGRGSSGRGDSSERWVHGGKGTPWARRQWGCAFRAIQLFGESLFGEGIFQRFGFPRKVNLGSGIFGGWGSFVTGTINIASMSVVFYK